MNDEKWDSALEGLSGAADVLDGLSRDHSDRKLRGLISKHTMLADRIRAAAVYVTFLEAERSGAMLMPTVENYLQAKGLIQSIDREIDEVEACRDRITDVVDQIKERVRTLERRRLEPD